MRKILFGAFALFLMTSCTGNGTSEKINEDTARVTDSIAQIEATNAATEQAKQDSTPQNSSTKVEAAAEYDDLVNNYVNSVKSIDKAAKKGDFSKMHSLINNYNSALNKINKVRSKLSPEQLSKVKKAEKKYKKLANGTIAA